jgi:tetratricopeptide (TPR) repeat protein
MAICNHCGFVTYPDRINDKNKLKDYYKEDYRRPPTVANFFTENRKLTYHNHFLKDVIESFKDKKAVIGEVGCAMGTFLAWVKHTLPDSEVHGTEWTESFKRVAYWEHQLRLEDDLPVKEYDMICTYKVAEHQIDVDKELLRYNEMLKTNGYLYISVPTWFNSMVNAGVAGFDLNYYYHTDHINVWTREHFKALLKKTGFKILKENYFIYGDTFLCIKDKPEPIEVDLKPQVLESLDRIKKAFILASEHKYKEAIEVWNDYPLAWISNFEMTRKELHEEGWDAINDYIARALRNCPDSPDVVALSANTCMKYDKYEQAIAIWEDLIERRPAQEKYVFELADCYRVLFRKDNKPEYMQKVNELMSFLRSTKPQHFNQATTLIYADHSNIEIPSNEPN